MLAGARWHCGWIFGWSRFRSWLSWSAAGRHLGGRLGVGEVGPLPRGLVVHDDGGRRAHLLECRDLGIGLKFLHEQFLHERFLHKRFLHEHGKKGGERGGGFRNGL